MGALYDFYCRSRGTRLTFRSLKSIRICTTVTFYNNTENCFLLFALFFKSHVSSIIIRTMPVSTSSPRWILLFALGAAAMLDTAVAKTSAGSGTPFSGNFSIYPACTLISESSSLLPVPTNATATGSTPSRDPVGVQCSIVDEAQTNSGKTAAKALGPTNGELRVRACL